MIWREIGSFARDNASWFPVAVTGPRQSGKSTLVRELFADYDYENLELPGTRQLARQDPTGFVRERRNRLVIDEAQLAPDLFSIVQVESDAAGEPGQYILSGCLRKRLTKTPKLYFYDTGLLCHLLGLDTLEQFRARAHTGERCSRTRSCWKR